MIGNDIIDLRLTKFKNAERFKRYAQKICTPRELELFGHYESKELSLWRFWSLKEAAFKAAVRLGYQERFSPINTQVTLKNNLEAIVSIGTFSFNGKTIKTENYIYSEVTALDHCRSTTNSIVEMENQDLSLFQIQKEGRLPYLINEGQLLAASVSHHGKYYALMHQQ